HIVAATAIHIITFRVLNKCITRIDPAVGVAASQAFRIRPKVLNDRSAPYVKLAICTLTNRLTFVVNDFRIIPGDKSSTRSWLEVIDMVGNKNMKRFGRTNSIEN